MICPHCGKQTLDHERCDSCGNSTDFAKRANFQSVGTSDNEIILPGYQHSSRIPAEAIRGNASPDETNQQDNSCMSSSKSNDTAEDKNWRSKYRTKACTNSLLCCVIVILAVMSIASGYAFQQILNRVDSISNEIATHRCCDLIEEAANVESMIPINDSTSGDENGKTLLFLEANLTDQMGEPDINFPECVSIAEQLPVLDDISETETALVWHFTGWNTQPDGTGINIPYGQVLELPLSEDVTLYAQWEPENTLPQS